jgi:hypothetical protein
LMFCAHTVGNPVIAVDAATAAVPLSTERRETLFLNIFVMVQSP